ncbi:hypothetical protein PS720_05269 [Pseudomonas fluorescens]|nr:hypothetical protein PS720_05269 [Pseudomonas fluorescens]
MKAPGSNYERRDATHRGILTSYGALGMYETRRIALAESLPA